MTDMSFMAGHSPLQEMIMAESVKSRRVGGIILDKLHKK